MNQMKNQLYQEASTTTSSTSVISKKTNKMTSSTLTWFGLSLVFLCCNNHKNKNNIFMMVSAQQNYTFRGNKTHSSYVALGFDYKSTSLRGPLYWNTNNIDTDGNEWEQYRYHDDEIDLDVVGNECGSNRRPSPIHLQSKEDFDLYECTDTHEILTRKAKSTDCVFEDLTFSITPHALRADFPYDDLFCQRPTIDLPNGYPFRWPIHHMEVHIRAEHVVEGRRYDGEIQMYHLGTRDQKRELSVVSILLEANALQNNTKLQVYIDAWENEAAAAANAEMNMKNETNTGFGHRNRRRRRRHLRESFRVNQSAEQNDQASFPYYYYTDVATVSMDSSIRRAVDHPDHRGLMPSLDNQEPNNATMTTTTTTTNSTTAAMDSTNSINSTVSKAVPEVEHNSEAPAPETTTTTTTTTRPPETTTTTTTSSSSSPPQEKSKFAFRHKMFPYDLWPTIYFYRYRGMITMPPCSEIVAWRVLDEPLKISRVQFYALARLLSGSSSSSSSSSSSGGGGSSTRMTANKLSETGENVKPLEEWNTARQELVHCTSKNFGRWLYPAHVA